MCMYIYTYGCIYIWVYICIWVYTCICTNTCFPLEIKTQCHSILQVSFVYLFPEIPLRSCESSEWPGSPEEPPISASLARGVELRPTTIATFAHVWGLNRDPHACTASISLTEHPAHSPLTTFHSSETLWGLCGPSLVSMAAYSSRHYEFGLHFHPWVSLSASAPSPETLGMFSLACLFKFNTMHAIFYLVKILETCWTNVTNVRFTTILKTLGLR